MASAPDYAAVTEATDGRVTREALSMLYTRYRYAAGYCAGRDVLEVACGSGPGLGYLAGTARRVIGGDVTESLVRRAYEHYRGRLPILRLDAHGLPFRDRSFDVTILYEAIYYLDWPARFVAECRRVLRGDGIVLICSVNREWPDFNPSPLSTRYFAAGELAALLRQGGFDPELYGAFAVARDSVRDVAVSAIRRLAVALHLVPRTMRGKELLKRIFLGALVPVPAELDEGVAPYSSPAPIPLDGPCPGYKVLYAVGHAG